MKLTVLELIIMGLAVFRLTHLIVFDKITEFIRSPFFNEITEADENGLEEVYLVPKEGESEGLSESCYHATGVPAYGWRFSATGDSSLSCRIPAVSRDHGGGGDRSHS